MRKQNILKEKNFEFALRIIELFKDLQSSHKGYVLSKQMLRIGIAIGVLIRESENAASRKDFLNKLNIAWKEADETSYWLELLFQSNFKEQTLYDSLLKDCKELIRIVGSVKTLKQSLV